MISLEESIPQKNDIYLHGEDIFYIQFNDISFYIEDKDQENFYFCILKNLFPDIMIGKIFPLNGKKNVIKEAISNMGDRKKVYIVDKDFDDIFENIITNSNIFYLQRYSTENYLLEEDAFVQYIISEKPRLNIQTITINFNIEKALTHIRKAITSLIYLHLVVQTKCPHLKNISLNYQRFIEFTAGSFNLRNDQIEAYKINIQSELVKLDKRFTINGQFNKMKRTLKLNTNASCVTHVPGKYLIRMMKQLIESSFGLVSRDTDSFCYRIAEKCKFNSLVPLKLNIENYING